MIALPQRAPTRMSPVADGVVIEMFHPQEMLSPSRRGGPPPTAVLSFRLQRPQRIGDYAA